MSGIRKHFDTIEDPRNNDWNIDHEFGDVLIIALCAVIGGAEGWEDIETFGTCRRDWFEEKLQLRDRGIPSNDTFRRVISRIAPEHFQACFLGWIREAVGALGGDFVAIDGKTLRGSYEDGDPKAAIHMVSAWASENEMVLAQRKTDEKSNEITAIPELLALLDLEGCIVTIDAMGCQTEIAGQIREAEADYLLALKGNQGNLHAEAQEYFEEGKNRRFDAVPVSKVEQTEISHDRREVRRCYVSTDVEWLPGYEEWTDLTSIALVEYCRDTCSEQAETQQRLYISSSGWEAEELLEATRRHLGIRKQSALGPRCELRGGCLTHPSAGRSGELLAATQNRAQYTPK